MTELSNRCLDTFPTWLRTLATDASELSQVLALEGAPESARRYVAGGLNYLFKSLDLIPDGIEDLGFLDDAFVLRVAASLALAESPAVAERAPVVSRLAGEAKLIAELLGKDYPRLEAYAKTLTKGAARGRTVDEILADDQVRASFLHEVTGWASSYETPSFTRDEKNLVKLQSFLSAKLPA
ncbi:MAG: YkvA family protein [Byssovorax sp.]